MPTPIKYAKKPLERARDRITSLLIASTSPGASLQIQQTANKLIVRELRRSGLTLQTAKDMFAMTETTMATPEYRAAYLVNAAHRVAKSRGNLMSRQDSLVKEHRYFNQHLRVDQDRKVATAILRAHEARYGSILGWYARMDGRVTPECAALNGKNFDTRHPPKAGLPGIVHAGCRCTAGPPHHDGGMLEQEPGAASIELSVKSKAAHGVSHAAKSAFDEAKHPRNPMGSGDKSGEFRDVGGTAKGVVKKVAIIDKPSFATAIRPKGQYKAGDITSGLNLRGVSAEAKPGVNKGLAAIKKVHGSTFMGEHRKVNVVSAQDHNFAGTYHSGGLHEDTIKISDFTEEFAINFIHEFGHYADARVLGEEFRDSSDNWDRLEGKTSQQITAWRTWHEAVVNSPEIKGMIRRSKRKNKSVTERTLVPYNRYLLSPPEVWARGYMQYVVLRSGDTELKGQLDTDIYEDSDTSPMNWSWKNFEPIAAAMDALFAAEGQR